MSDQIKTAESVAIERFVRPVIAMLPQTAGSMDEAIIRRDLGAVNLGPVRSDVEYERRALALTELRSKRKEMTEYFKGDPGPDRTSPGRGMCFLARRTWEAANSFFNMFDNQFGALDSALTGSMSSYRQEVERKAREEAEAKAALERKRREAEAAEQRRIAEAERKKAEAARGKRAREEAEQRAREAEANQRVADLHAEQVPVVIEREVPKVAGHSVRRTWRAEVVDLKKLVQAVAEGLVPLDCLVPNDSRLNKLAEAWGGQNPPAGVRFVEKEIAMTRSSR